MSPNIARLAWLGATLAVSQAGAAVDYATEIQPIFSRYCYTCHQGDKAAAKLRLDSKAAALTGGVSGPVIKPGDSKASPILSRLSAANPKVRMPLGGTALPPEKIALIRAWIDQGAAWNDQKTGNDQKSSQKHWAYIKPERPSVPSVRDSGWVRNPIDAYVLARLEKEGLKPSAAASKETLIRRVSLDLTGLPPTMAEVDQFLADQTPQAYEKLVDRLLASPHYGERWARPWLDLARYADTNGYEADRSRVIWRYRDWVIQALNRDIPFDQFTIEQIAGDMLTDATPEQRIATGFHRNTMFNQEGGVDRDEALFEVLVDRVNTTATVWLGSTLGCAQCHDHKYDPFTQAEYYKLMAFFSRPDVGVEKANESTSRYLEPRLDLPTPEQESARTKLQAEIRDLDERLRNTTPDLERDQAEWERSIVASRKSWSTLEPSALKTTAGATLTLRQDGVIVAAGPNPQSEVYLIDAKTNVGGITGIRLEALPDPSLPRGGPGRDPYGNFLLTTFEFEAASAQAPDRFEKIAFEEILADNGTINDRKFRQLWTVDASREDERLPRQIVFATAKPFGAGETLLRIRLRHDSEFGRQGLGSFRISVTSAKDPKTIVGITHRLRSALDMAEADRTADTKKELAAYFRSVAPSLTPARRRLAAARRELDAIGIVNTLVMGDRPSFERPSTNIRIRGAFLSKGDLVYAATPAILPPLPETEAPNRLGLARWLASKENPLTARVAVNRFWEQFFGRGIVETAEDFGSQGSRPTHPELLDWLAVEFMDRGWSMKAIHKTIVMSAAYRQSSKVSPELLQRDPDDRLISHGPRFRMEAEMVRDVALAASGLISLKIGGPSVFPPQPEGIWDLPYNDDKWIESKGEDRYRRGLYTFIRRTAPYPSMLNFDSVSREGCTVRRVRTNTPLQALTSLNDPAFFEAAKALAKRILSDSSADARSRMELAFRLCVSRRPNQSELDRMLSFQEQERRYFEEHRADAEEMTGSGDAQLASWTMLSNVLLNLDETLTKE